MGILAAMEPVPVYGINEFSEGKNEGFFYSNDLRSHLESHKFVNAPHRHSTYISILFTKGKGTHQIDFDTFAVRPGSIFLLSPGQVHCWKLSKDISGFVFFHTKEFYENIFLRRKIEEFSFFYLQQNYPVIYLKAREANMMEALFRQVNEEFHASRPYKDAMLGTLTDLIYITLSRLYRPEEPAAVTAGAAYFKVKKLQKLIDEYFRTKKFPGEYADLMNMSTRHLSRICRETLGKSTNELIIDRIITEAQRMLVHSDISIGAVAEGLGYEDHSYFVRLFKKKTGLSPREFQHKIRKEL